VVFHKNFHWVKIPNFDFYPSNFPLIYQNRGEIIIIFLVLVGNFVEIWNILCEKKVRKIEISDKIQHVTKKVLDIISIGFRD
jgi:hypothetical protein